MYTHTCIFVHVMRTHLHEMLAGVSVEESESTLRHYPKYHDNVSFQGLLKFAPT